MHHFCTYFDENYLVRALALYKSLREHDPAFTLWALCLDVTSERVLRDLNLPWLTPLSLGSLESADRDLLAAKSNRNKIEYFFTLTPALCRWLLATHPEIDVLSYLDADLKFFANPERVLERMGSGSVIIIPHGFPGKLAYMAQFGRFNVGMVSFRNDDDGLACLDRWRARCLEWCYDRVEDGRYADQGYLDDWPERHRGVVVVDHPGIGLGPWNFERFRIEVSGLSVSVDGEPLVFYHFHALKGLTGRVFDDGLSNYGRMSWSVRGCLYGGYVRDLAEAQRFVTSFDIQAGRSGRGGRVGLRGLSTRAVQRRLLVRVGNRVFG